MHRAVVEVIGEAAAWSVVDRNVVGLLPGQEAQVSVFLRPPRLPVPHAGPVSFAVKVTPGEDTDESVVAAADVVVGAFQATTATIKPAISMGLGRARQTVSVHNGGNTQVPVDISVDDGASVLELEVAPSTLLIDPGSTGKARVAARALSDGLRAVDRTSPYRLTVRTGDGPALELEGEVRLRTFGVGPLAGIACLVAVLLVVAAVRTRPSPSPSAQQGSSTTALPTPVSGPSTSLSPPTTTATTAGTAALVGEAAAISMGAECRATSDLKVNGRILSNTDRTFVRTFADEATAIAGRNLLTRHPMVCTVGNPAADDAVLTFHPPPANSVLGVPGSRCSARYAPAGLGKSKTPDGLSFVLEVGPKQFLFFLKEADRDRAFVLLQAHTQICWLGGGGDDIFSTFFDWAGAVTYF